MTLDLEDFLRNYPNSCKDKRSAFAMAVCVGVRLFDTLPAMASYMLACWLLERAKKRARAECPSLMDQCESGPNGVLRLTRRGMLSAEDNDMTLGDLIKWARIYVAENPRTPEQIRESIISFAYGNVKIHNPAITREMVEREYDRLQDQ